MKHATLASAFALSALAAAMSHAGVSPVTATADVVPGKPLDKPFDKPWQSDAVTIDAEPDPRCDFNPPAPALVGSRYADYHAVRNRDDPNQSPGKLTESATLDDGTRLRVVSYGCVDSTGHTFESTYTNATHDAKDVAFWANQARATLASIGLGEQVYGVNELRDWLGRAGTLKRHGNKVVQCHDNTQPSDDTCDWQSGGSFSIAVEQHGTEVSVTIGVDYSG